MSQERAPASAPGLMDVLPAAVIRWDAVGHVLDWNHAAESIFGWHPDSVVGRSCPVLSSLVGEEGPELRGQILAGERLSDVQLQVTRADGSIIDVSLSTAPVPTATSVQSVVGVALDITDRQRRTRQLQHLASHDPLTDLLNRRAFRTALGRVVRRTRHGGPPGALLLADLDGLKGVNDEFGHAAGDALLISVASILRATVRPGDLIGRLGGDEFAIGLERVTIAEAMAIAGRVRASIAELRIGPDGPAGSTASIGGIVIDGTLDVSELLACADDALYTAKQTRDTVEMMGLRHPQAGDDPSGGRPPEPPAQRVTMMRRARPAIETAIHLHRA